MSKRSLPKIRSEFKDHFEFVETDESGGKLRCLHSPCKSDEDKVFVFKSKQGWTTHINHLVSFHNNLGFGGVKCMKSRSLYL